jgi:cytochrome P450
MRFLDQKMIVDPYPCYAEWRERAPVWWDEGIQGWIVTWHDDVRTVLKDSEGCSSDAFGDGFRLPLLTDDPPRHSQLRALVDRAFTVRMLRSIEGRIAEIAEGLVDRIESGAAVDVVAALTTPLPVAVIAQMMGIPVERSEDFKRWSDALTGTLAGVSIESREREIFEMTGFFRELIGARRRRPTNDLVSTIVNAEIDGERLSDADIIGFCILLLIAGNETTTNLLGNLLNILADAPVMYARLVSDPALIDAAIEETLRYDAPVQFLMRRATKHLELNGVTIAAGERLHVVMGSANRDPRAYDDPDTFSLDRSRNHHHAFGFGIHFCIGAPLARLEARTAMRALIARFPRMARAAGANERVPSQVLRGFNRLWLQFEAR